MKRRPREDVLGGDATETQATRVLLIDRLEVEEQIGLDKRLGGLMEEGAVKRRMKRDQRAAGSSRTGSSNHMSLLACDEKYAVSISSSKPNRSAGAARPFVLYSCKPRMAVSQQAIQVERRLSSPTASGDDRPRACVCAGRRGSSSAGVWTLSSASARKRGQREEGKEKQDPLPPKAHLESVFERERDIACPWRSAARDGRRHWTGQSRTRRVEVEQVNASGLH